MTRNNVFVVDRRVLRRYIGDKLIFDDLSDKTEVLSGEEIFTDKADADAVVHVEVDGKSYQHAGSGKNLFRTKELKSLNATSWVVTAYVYNFKLKPNTKYTLSSNVPTEGNGEETVLYFNGSITSSNGVYDGKSNTQTTDSEGNIFIATPVVRTYTEPLRNGDYWVQLEEGSTATEYEPPAPTPDYPIEIHSLNDFDVVSSVGRENLIGKSNIIKGGWITDTGALQINLSTPRVASDFIEIVPGSDMTFTYDGYDYIGSSTKKVMGVYDKDKIFIERLTSTVIDKVWKIKLNNQAKFVKLGYGTSSSEYDNYAKLEVGSESTPWNYSHKDLENNLNNNFINKINLLLDEPLRSLGNVKDRLFRDTDGLWKVEQNVGKRILNGSENWSAQADGSYYTNFSDKKIDVNTNLQSSHFMAVIGSAETLDIGRMRNTTSNTNVVFYFDEGVKGAGNFKSWLSLNNTKVYYELTTPIIETLPQPLQDKLNNIASYANSNYVYTVLPDKSDILSEKLKPTLHTTFKSKGWEDFRRKTIGGIT